MPPRPPSHCATVWTTLLPSCSTHAGNWHRTGRRYGWSEDRQEKFLVTVFNSKSLHFWRRLPHPPHLHGSIWHSGLGPGRVCVRACRRARAGVRACVCVCMRACVYACVHACVRACVRECVRVCCVCVRVGSHALQKVLIQSLQWLEHMHDVLRLSPDLLKGTWTEDARWREGYIGSPTCSNFECVQRGASRRTVVVCVINCSARIICKLLKLPTSLLYDLHWLPISSQVQCKIALACFHIVSSAVPPQLTCLISTLLALFAQSRSWRPKFGYYLAGATWNCCGLGAFCVHHTSMHQVTLLHAKPPK